MMSALGNALALLLMPIVVVGVIHRIKSRWAGRRGPPILQLAFDLWRLMRKVPVYSTVTTPVFRLAPYVVLVTAAASACIAPVLSSRPLLSFEFDFVWFAYVWALGRIALILGALDTGSSFEGMGASREATFSVILEPVLFLVAGALSLHTTGSRSFHLLLMPHLDGGPALVMSAAAIVALTIVVQVEAARMPIDDPTTHLELTMVHEVMILDHSGPELAALQYGAAIKLYTGLSVVTTLLNPWASVQPSWLAAASHLALVTGVAAAIGLSESLIARLKLRVIPQYIVVAMVASAVALLAVLAMTGRTVAAGGARLP
jgi:formate hydrogenlyase subunit 4